VIRHPAAEADDVIARWIALHPQDHHTIVSSDTDFVQLIAPNVRQYNGVMEHVITHEGIFDDKGKPVIDKKTKEPKSAPNPEWLLFEKCMRGDTSDNVFSAYPGVRTKGTSKKVGLTEAFEDRNSKGFAWNNLMLQRWSDHEGKEHRVLEDYERNRRLIDLSHQPDDIKEIMFATIAEATTANKNISQVGIRLIKFCNLYDLKKIAEQAQSYAEPLNARYNIEENHGLSV
jgi:5'-3' exonuclease